MAKRREESLPLIPMKEGRIIHNVKGRKIHIMGANFVKELPITASDEEVQLEAIRPRRFKGNRKLRHHSSSNKYTIITEKIQPGDTLTSLAAKFDPLERPRPWDKHTSPDSGVTSSDPEQMRPKVLMAQIGDSYFSDSAEGDVESGPEHETEAMYQTVSLKSALKWKHNTNTLLEQLDLNLAEIRSNNPTLKTDLNQATIAMQQPCIYPLTEEKLKKEDSYLRLSVIAAIFFIGVIAISVVVIILYFTHTL